MKRTGFKKKPLREGPSLQRSEHPRSRETPKKCEAPKCGKDFVPARMGQKVCGPVCARRLVEAKRVEERELYRQRKERLVTVSEREEKCRRIVQKIARLRDRHDPCISCDKPASWQGQWHGSHYRSHGACSALQFHLWNIHKACWICNKLYSGRIDQYKPRLIKKIGQERHDWLMAQNYVIKEDSNYVEYLKRFQRVMGKRLKRLERKVQRECDA